MTAIPPDAGDALGSPEHQEESVPCRVLIADSCSGEGSLGRGRGGPFFALKEEIAKIGWEGRDTEVSVAFLRGLRMALCLSEKR